MSAIIEDISKKAGVQLVESANRDMAKAEQKPNQQNQQAISPAHPVTNQGSESMVVQSPLDSSSDTISDTESDNSLDSSSDTISDIESDSSLDSALDTISDIESDSSLDSSLDTISDIESDSSLDSALDTISDIESDNSLDSSSDTISDIESDSSLDSSSDTISDIESDSIPEGSNPNTVSTDGEKGTEQPKSNPEPVSTVKAEPFQSDGQSVDSAVNPTNASSSEIPTPPSPMPGDWKKIVSTDGEKGTDQGSAPSAKSNVDQPKSKSGLLAEILSSGKSNLKPVTLSPKKKTKNNSMAASLSEIIPQSSSSDVDSTSSDDGSSSSDDDGFNIIHTNSESIQTQSSPENTDQGQSPPLQANSFKSDSKSGEKSLPSGKALLKASRKEVGKNPKESKNEPVDLEKALQIIRTSMESESSGSDNDGGSSSSDESISERNWNSAASKKPRAKHHKKRSNKSTNVKKQSSTTHSRMGSRKGRNR